VVGCYLANMVRSSNKGAGERPLLAFGVISRAGESAASAKRNASRLGV
jgi:hypothetical protein